MQKRGSKSLNKSLGGVERSGIVKPRFGGATAWSPASKSGLLFWFKADAGVTQSSNLVTGWADQSGNGRNASASGATRPTYTASALNGLPGISFPSGTYMDFGTDQMFDGAAPFCFVMVVKNTNPGGTYYNGFINILATAANRAFAGIFSNDVNYATMNFGYIRSAALGAGAVIKSNGDFTTNAVKVAINYDGVSATATSSWDVYRAGSLTTLSTGGSSQTNAAVNRMGCWYDGGLPLLGSLYELFAYSSELTTDERAELDAYLSAKWGV